MEPRDPSFAWSNYLKAHHATIALRRLQARKKRVCSLCGARAVEGRTLVHVALRQVGAEALDPKHYVKALGLCEAHKALNHDELADFVWPRWREKWDR
jgi:hypothetical protein